MSERVIDGLIAETDSLRAQLARVTAERDEARADAGVMREAIERACDEYAADAHRNSSEGHEQDAQIAREKCGALHVLLRAIPKPHPGQSVIEERERLRVACRAVIDRLGCGCGVDGLCLACRDVEESAEQALSGKDA